MRLDGDEQASQVQSVMVMCRRGSVSLGRALRAIEVEVRQGWSQVRLDPSMAEAMMEHEVSSALHR